MRSFIEPTFNNEGGDPKCARRWPDLVNGELKSGTGNPGNKGLKTNPGKGEIEQWLSGAKGVCAHQEKPEKFVYKDLSQDPGP